MRCSSLRFLSLHRRENRRKDILHMRTAIPNTIFRKTPSSSGSRAQAHLLYSTHLYPSCKIGQTETLQYLFIPGGLTLHCI
jgi:hypothetical protein